MYTIRLNDGTEIKASGANGNHFVADERFDTGIFAGKLNGVQVICDGEDDPLGMAGTHDHMKLANEMMYQDKFHFLLLDVTAEEIEKAQNRADLEYRVYRHDDRS